MAILAPVMKFIRTPFVRIVFVFSAGIAFLNMGFVLFEANLLEMDKNLPVFYNLSNFGAEEEEQGEEAPGHEAGKEVDLHVDDMLAHHQALTSNTEDREKHLFQQKVIAGFLSRFSPPPEHC